MNWNKDSGLQLRMGSVIVMLALLYSVFIATLTVYAGTFLIAIGVTAAIAGLTWNGPKIAMKTTNSHRVSPQEYPELCNRVNKLSHQAGMVAPDVAVSDSQAPNAFVTGRSGDSAVLCVTKGLLESLEGEELDAVLAHELSHVKNRDMMIMMVASTIATVAHFVVRWGWIGDSGAEPGQGSGAIIGAIVVSFVTWIASYILMRILSKYREYTADRGAVAITGRPMALVSALQSISDEVSDTPDEDLRELSSTNAMNFYELEADRMSRMMSTHPDADKRIEKLKQMR